MIIIIFLIVFSAVVFFAPDMGGYFLEHANFEPADPLRTPEHIAPVWYFTPFYAILRAVPDKLLGVALMGSAVMLLFFLPWLDRCRVKSIRYRSWIYKLALMVFAITLRRRSATSACSRRPALCTMLSLVFTILYFAFFVFMPFYTRIEKTKPVPTRVT